MQKTYQLTDSPRVNSMMAFEYPAGDMIPHAWYDKIVTTHTVTLERAATGKDGQQARETETYQSPYWLAMHLLSKIVYWYTPRQDTYPDKPNVVVLTKRFGKGQPQEYLKASYWDLAKWTHESYDANKRAIVYLEKEGYVKRIFKTTSNGDKGLKKEMYIDIVPEKVMAITYPAEILPQLLRTVEERPQEAGPKDAESMAGSSGRHGRAERSREGSRMGNPMPLGDCLVQFLNESTNIENSSESKESYDDNLSTSCEGSMNPQMISCVEISTVEGLPEQASDLRESEGAPDNLMRGNFHDIQRLSITKNTSLCDRQSARQAFGGKLSEGRARRAHASPHESNQSAEGKVSVAEALSSWPQEAIDSMRQTFGETVDRDFVPVIEEALSKRGYGHA